MASDGNIEVRTVDLPGLRLLVALLALVTWESAYQAERAPWQTRDDWAANCRNPFRPLDARKVCAGRIQMRQGGRLGRWVTV